MRTGKTLALAALASTLLAAAVFAPLPAQAEEETTAKQEKSLVFPDENWSENPQIMIDSVLYDLPISIKKLLDDGWTWKEDPQITSIEPYTLDHSTLVMEKQAYRPSGEKESGFRLKLIGPMNPFTDQARPLEECYAQAVELDTRKPFSDEILDKYPVVVIPKNITYGSTGEDIEEAYGKTLMYGESEVSFKMNYTGENGAYYLIVNDTLGLVSVNATGAWRDELADR